jgi:hypothetical protein
MLIYRVHAILIQFHNLAVLKLMDGTFKTMNIVDGLISHSTRDMYIKLQDWVNESPRPNHLLLFLQAFTYLDIVFRFLIQRGRVSAIGFHKLPQKNQKYAQPCEGVTCICGRGPR